MDVQALLAVNPQITDPRLIHTGERLVISPIDLATIGGRDFSPVAMNDRGQIVGRRDTADGTSHAALLEDGVLTDLATSAQDFTPVAINDRGQVVGMTGTDPTKAHAAIWEDGALTDLGTLGGGASEAIDINDRGQVIGMSETAAGGQTHPFLWQGGRMTDLGTSPGLAGRDVYPMALGDRGEVVVVTADYPWHVLVWRDGAVTDLGLEEQSEGWVFDINDRGQVVGNPGGPALWTDGRDERLPGLPVPPDAPDRWTAVEALNNAGQAVGWSGTGVLARSPLVHGYDSTLHRAVLWTEGRVVDLGTLRTTDSEAYAINDCGMVLGESFDRGPAGYEAGHPVLWYVPTPERAVSQ